jgi:hypothetical protein
MCAFEIKHELLKKRRIFKQWHKVFKNITQISILNENKWNEKYYASPNMSQQQFFQKTEKVFLLTKLNMPLSSEHCKQTFIYIYFNLYLGTWNKDDPSPLGSSIKKNSPYNKSIAVECCGCYGEVKILDPTGPLILILQLASPWAVTIPTIRS